MTARGVKHSRKCSFGHSPLFFTAANNLFLSFEGLRMISFFLQDSIVFSQELKVFFRQITVFCFVHGFSILSPFFKAI